MEVCLGVPDGVWVLLKAGFWDPRKVLKEVEKPGRTLKVEECNPEESIVSEEGLQAGSGAAGFSLSALRRMLVSEEASLLDARWRVWAELGKTGSGVEKIYPGGPSPVSSARTLGCCDR